MAGQIIDFAAERARRTAPITLRIAAVDAQSENPFTVLAAHHRDEARRLRAEAAELQAEAARIRSGAEVIPLYPNSTALLDAAECHARAERLRLLGDELDAMLRGTPS